MMTWSKLHYSDLATVQFVCQCLRHVKELAQSALRAQFSSAQQSAGFKGQLILVGIRQCVPEGLQLFHAHLVHLTQCAEALRWKSHV